MECKELKASDKTKYSLVYAPLTQGDHFQKKTNDCKMLWIPEEIKGQIQPFLKLITNLPTKNNKLIKY